jgi:hypothetical protein
MAQRPQAIARPFSRRGRTLRVEGGVREGRGRGPERASVGAGSVGRAKSDAPCHLTRGAGAGGVGGRQVTRRAARGSTPLRPRDPYATAGDPSNLSRRPRGPRSMRAAGVGAARARGGRGLVAPLLLLLLLAAAAVPAGAQDEAFLTARERVVAAYGAARSAARARARAARAAAGGRGCGSERPTPPTPPPRRPPAPLNQAPPTRRARAGRRSAAAATPSRRTTRESRGRGSRRARPPSAAPRSSTP